MATDIMVCDAIMGSGKSSAAITYMNEHRDERFIYITPYNDETERIRASCPGLDFAVPEKNVPGTGYSKSGHIAKLVQAGRNISATHQAFKFLAAETWSMIQEQGYTLFIDESLQWVDTCTYSHADLQLLTSAGVLGVDGDEHVVLREEYFGDVFRDVVRMLRSRDLITYQDSDSKKTFAYWKIPPSAILCFQKVFVMTYIFKGQDIAHMFEMYRLPYRMIGIERDAGGTYRFSDTRFSMPDYTANLGSMIHILDNRKINSVGDGTYNLSMTWYAKNPAGVERLKKNVANYFTHIQGDKPAGQRMWGCYDEDISKLKGKGYSTKHVTFTSRATNKFRDRTVLVYAVNLFMNGTLKSLYAQHGVRVDDNMYALSTMVQWIWRSAIRDGKEIWIYVPSKRMRSLLQNWIKDVERQYQESKTASEQ